MLRLATVLGVALPDHLFKPTRHDPSWLRKLPGHQDITWPARAKPRIDWASAQQALDLEIQAEAALPVAQVASLLQIDARHPR